MRRKALSVLVLCILVAGCSSQSHQIVRTGLFNNSSRKMLTAFNEVRPGMTLFQLEELGFDFEVNNVEHLSGPEALKVIFGDQIFSAVVAADRLDALLEESNRYEAYVVPLVDVVTTSDRSFSQTNVKKRGMDLRLLFVLKDDAVVYAGDRRLRHYEKGLDAKFAVGLLDTLGAVNGVGSLVK